jgi:hypothetical protein
MLQIPSRTVPAGGENEAEARVVTDDPPAEFATAGVVPSSETATGSPPPGGHYANHSVFCSWPMIALQQLVRLDRVPVPEIVPGDDCLDTPVPCM